MSQAALDKFDQFLALAEEAGIYVDPTGPDHWEGLPEWAQTERYADGSMLNALEPFWRMFATRCRRRTVLFAVLFADDLLNEPQVPWDSPHLRPGWNAWLDRRYTNIAWMATAWNVPQQSLVPKCISVPPREDCLRCPKLLDFQHFRQHVAQEWIWRQVRAIRAVDPDALVTGGLVQWSVPLALAGRWHYSGSSPHRIAAYLDFLQIHFCPLAGGFYADQPEDDVGNLAYLYALLQELGRASKSVVLDEFG
ncbi:MAG: beta-galactosidase [Verrucomicrobiota bacterium]|nr:beta-galactosidase [Limisphaera sp.]MDW8380674.1 beta-galactosidase [Verrucomicrobiota bacterium]